MLRNESIFHNVKHKLINTKFLQAGVIQRFRLRIHKKITLFLLSAVMHHLSEEIPKYFSLILHKKEEGLDSLASSLSSFFLPLRILFCSSFFFLFLTIPIVLISVSPEPLRPPLHLLISLSLSDSFSIFPFSSSGSPPLHFWRRGNEIFKAVLLLRPIFRQDRATPFFLCLSLVCVCAPVCVCWHAHHAAVTAAHPQILC